MAINRTLHIQSLNWTQLACQVSSPSYSFCDTRIKQEEEENDDDDDDDEFANWTFSIFKEPFIQY